MQNQSFSDYIYKKYNVPNSGTANSYLKAIEILDGIFAIDDVFNLNSQSLCDLRDPYLIENIIEYVADEEDKFRKGQSSMFDLGNPKQTSYPRRRFCTSAIRRLGEFINNVCINEAIRLVDSNIHDARSVSTTLTDRFKINIHNTEKERTIKQRIGQDIFRAMLLNIYGSRCCLTGLDVPEVLRASHIIPWAECEETRLNPQNGLCLSATYDAAFDKHLITFDEQFRMVLSPTIKEEYTSEAFKNYFLKFEGKAITFPTKHLPSQKFLEQHRSKLIV